MAKKDILPVATQTLLLPNELTEDQLFTLVEQIASSEIDIADIFLQYIHSEAWELEDGIVKSSSFSISQGAGIRAVSGEKTGFAYTNTLNSSALEQAALTAKSIARKGDKISLPARAQANVHELYLGDDPLFSLSEQAKVDFLRQIDAEVRSIDSRIVRVNASLLGSYQVVLIANERGELAADIRPLVRCNVSVIAEENGRFEHGYAGGGGRTGYDIFLNNNLAHEYGREAARIALLNLQAVPAPAGVMTVVLGSGWPGVLLHEAVGHGLEGDFNRKQTSAFTGCLGKRVAHESVTVIDDGSMAGNKRGSLNVDDEGTPTQRTVLIENGILRNYMLDRLNARLLHMQPTGNGRRESYANIPLPRMTNTFMLPGSSTPKDIISSVDKGVYAVNFSGGQVDITSGKFVFSTSEAYLIEHGKIIQPLRGATIIGDGPTVLQHVTMVGNDLGFDTGVGICGKEGQSVPVGVGQPTLRVDDVLTVGGTSA